mgnify:FL=1
MYARRKITFRVIEHHEKHTNASCYINAGISLGNGRYDNRRGNGILYQIETKHILHRLYCKKSVHHVSNPVTLLFAGLVHKIILSGIYFPSRTYFFEKHSDGTPSERPDALFFTIRQHRPEKKLSLPCKGFRIALSTATRELKGNAVRIGNSSRCCKFRLRKEQNVSTLFCH